MATTLSIPAPMLAIAAQWTPKTALNRDLKRQLTRIRLTYDPLGENYGTYTLTATDGFIMGEIRWPGSTETLQTDRVTVCLPDSVLKACPKAIRAIITLDGESVMVELLSKSSTVRQDFKHDNDHYPDTEQLWPSTNEPSDLGRYCFDPALMARIMKSLDGHCASLYMVRADHNRSLYMGELSENEAKVRILFCHKYVRQKPDWLNDDPADSLAVITKAELKALHETPVAA
jgi:hypothetical protein